MRYFLFGREPEVTAILLVESGSRGIVEGVAHSLRATWCGDAPIDLVSCFSTLPQGFDKSTRVYRVSDYRGRKNRARLYRELVRHRYSHLGIVCSAEPLMTRWKWALVYQIPAKVFIINENCDYFWLDRRYLDHLGRLALFRAGLEGAGAVRTITRVLSFPFSLLYLLLYATTVHVRRALHRG